MDINSRLFHELEWPDSPSKRNMPQPEKQAEELPTEEKN